MTALLTATRAVEVDLTTADRAVLDRVLALSSAAAEDCDVIADRLRLSDVYVRRDVEQTIAESIRPRSLTALRGEAGYGKTAVLWHLHQRLGQAGRLALLIPATALLRGSRGDRDAGAVTVDELWTALRAAVRQRRDPVLLVDTIDLLTHSEQTRVDVRRLMRTAVECRVPMVVACRPAEAALLHLDQDGDESYGVPIRPMYLAAFNERERREAIESYAWAAYPDDGDEVLAVVQDAQVRGRPLREVVANPLTLRMLFELYAGDGERPDSDIDSIGLYTLMWQRRVVTDRRDRATPDGGPDLSRDVEQTALAMLGAGRIALRRSELTAWLDGVRPVDEALALLVARALVTRRPESPWLWFWHQTWFEYTAARAVARRGETPATQLGRFVAEEPYDLFFGEVASQLVLLAGRTPLVAQELAERLLGAWLADDTSGMPALALRTYARFREPSAGLRANAARALRAADDRVTKDFLRLLPSVSHPDAERWSADLAVAWERSTVRLVVLDALIRLAAADSVAARRFAIEHDCVEWLLDTKIRPVQRWRDHDSPHLRLLSAVAVVDPGWAAEQAMRFWQPLAAEGIVGGLADIVAFVARHDPAGGTPGQEHRHVIAAGLRATPGDESAVQLQVAYADLVAAAGDLPVDPQEALREALRDGDGGETWRRARLRVVGRAALDLPEPTAFLAALLDTGNPAETNHRATVLAELLSGHRRSAAEPPATRLVRAASRAVLASAAARAAEVEFFVAGIRYAGLDAAVLARILPDADGDPQAWFGPLHPLLVDAASVGGGGAEAALSWAGTPAAASVVSAKQLRDLGTRLQHLVENAPRLLTHLVRLVRTTRNPASLVFALDRLPADVSADQPDVLADVRALRDDLVAQREPAASAQGYVLWRTLVRNGLDAPPEPGRLADLLATRADRLRRALLGLAIEAIEQDAWPEQDVSDLLTAVSRCLDGGAAQARQILVGLLARTASLPADRTARQQHATQAIDYVFAAGYNVRTTQGLHDFTPCVTLLGRLVDRLLLVDQRQAAQVLLDIVDRLHALHPGPVHWRQTLAVKWRYTVTALVERLPADDRRKLAEHLLGRDPYLVADALEAAVTREQVVAPWILGLTEQLPDGARGRLRSRLFQAARERSTRRFPIPVAG
ncbi:ATP-binding protein [Micromonospora sp. B006]|uniref:ATP-binding protein n=1 Tax=Micromonospora sp. B006 TaxID=2201999 RepID=UPI000E335C35|nr:ATP-binding protein [Micromonospora sp. B006]AXO37847.1 hypothetical protein MicB006_5589 [Micromonospora sp. B006]